MYIRFMLVMLAVLAAGAAIIVGAPWIGYGGFNAIGLALGTLGLVLLCNLRWPVFARLRHSILYGAGGPAAADFVERVERKVRSSWLLVLCCAGASLWGLGLAALLAGEDALARLLWITVVCLNSCALLAVKGWRG